MSFELVIVATKPSAAAEFIGSDAVTRARGMTALARDTGLSREAL